MGKDSEKKLKAAVATDADMSDDESGEEAIYLSPIAEPLLDGKTLKKSLKLLKKTVSYERTLRAPKKDGSKQTSAAGKRQLKRGVAEVTKCIRKGQRGVVFLASDVYPIDIIAHFPVVCEEKEITYAYVGTKRTLGAACRSKRPASVLMVIDPTDDAPTNGLFKKTVSAIRKKHPYF